MSLVSWMLFIVPLNPSRLPASEIFPPFENNVAVFRFEFHAVASAVELFAGNERASRTEEGIEYDVAESRTVTDPTRAKFNRFHSGMHFRPQWPVDFPDLGLLAAAFVAALALPSVEAGLIHPLVFCRR